MKRIAVTVAFLCLSHSAFADISLTDRTSVIHLLARNPSARSMPVLKQQDASIPSKQKVYDANENTAKRDAKRASHPALVPNATGSISLIDSGGLEYFINTNITFSTSSSASGAASEASYTGPVSATTSLGGNAPAEPIIDAFDGYQTICVSLTNATGPCATGNPAFTIYNQNGPPTLDASCSNRQVNFPAKTIGPLSVSRKVFVPTNDQFIRWMNFFTNTSGAPVTFTMLTANNLGSDSATVIVNSSSGDAVAQTSDTWVTTFQNYSGTTSTDPRLGHILQGPVVPTPVSFINFANGDDNPWWVYSITLAPGQTKAILNFATGQLSKAAAAAQAALLVGLPSTTTQCLSALETSQIVNFVVAADLSMTKTSTPAGNVNPGQSYSYTLSVANSGGTATSVSVTDTLPAGVGFVSASGTGWTCNAVSGTVTCTLPSLANGSANPITINVTAPLTPGPITNTATVSSATTDSNPANNSGSANNTVLESADLSITKTATTFSAFGTRPITYNINVSNAGPTAASNVTVSDTLPAGAVFVSATGTGWTCGNALNVVTCTRPSLAVGAAPTITLTMNAPDTTTNTTLTNTATVSSTSPDPSPANNSGVSAVALQPADAVPTMSPSMLALLALLLSAAAWVVVGRRT